MVWCLSVKNCKKSCILSLKIKYLTNGNSLTTLLNLYLYGCLISIKELINLELGFTKDSQMSSGFPDFHSQLVSLLLSSSKLPESQMSQLTSLFGNSLLRNSILKFCHQPKKELISVGSSCKEQSGMEIKIASLSLNP